MKRRGFLATLAAAFVAPFAKVNGGEPVQAVRPKLTEKQRQEIIASIRSRVTVPRESRSVAIHVEGASGVWHMTKCNF